MKKHTAKFKYERETKNAVRYQEIEEPGLFPMIGQLYVQKAALVNSISNAIPQEITVTVEFNDAQS